MVNRNHLLASVCLPKRPDATIVKTRFFICENYSTSLLPACGQRAVLTLKGTYTVLYKAKYA